MGSINKSHNEADGGILLFNGELILLYCDSVHCEIGGKESFKGRVYLTTHRLVVILTPYRQAAPVKSLCAPFCAITKCSVEQPIFGANYIEATVRDETDPTKSFSFKLKFSKGGAIELALAMNRAVAAVGRNFNPSMPPPPAYTPSPGSEYYQAPPTVYAPGYNCGVQMPVQQFPDQPPIGFIYASSAPPPYPGLGTNGAPSNQGPPPPYSQPQTSSGPRPEDSLFPASQSSGFTRPASDSQPGYPTVSQSGHSQPTYPDRQPVYPQGYPQAQPQGYQQGYPQAQPQGYPQAQPQGYPQAQPQGYPQGYQGQQQQGYPQPQPNQPQTQQQQQQTIYPQLPSDNNQQPLPSGNPSQQPGSNQGSWPTAPSFNPNWQEDKKSS